MGEERSQLLLELPDLPLFEETNETEVSGLIWEALGRLTGSDPRAAIWRLVDAAGLLAEQHPDDVTVREGTDRGFRVIRTRRGLAVSPEWLDAAPADRDLVRAGHYQCAAGSAA
jgi:hypothetical protein